MSPNIWQIILGPDAAAGRAVCARRHRRPAGGAAPWLTRCSQIEGLTKRFGGVVASDDVALDVPRGRAARHHRPERRRQDHADRPARRRDRARRRPHPFRRPRHHGAAGPRPQPAGARALVPDHLAVSAISPRSTTSRSPCRRMPATRSASGATRAAKPELREPARAALDRVGLAHRADTVLATMSHGEHRQLELGMALATKPRMLLLDEPMAGLGPGRIRAHGARRCASSSSELTILLIEHDMEAVFALADRITVLVYGRVIASGEPAAIRANRRGAPGLSRRAGGGASWLSRCSQSTNIETRYGLQPGAVRHVARHRAGRDGDADGPQRHGQDHDRALDHGADAGDGRLDPLRRPGDPRACRPTAWRSSASAWCPRAGRFSRISPTRENLVATAANRLSAADPWTLDKVCALFPAARRAAAAAWATSSPAASSRCSRSAAR